MMDDKTFPQHMLSTSARAPFQANVWQMPVNSPLGSLTLVASDKGLCGVWFEDQAHKPDLRHLPWGPSQHWLRLAKTQLTEYFAGKRSSFDLPLDLANGSAFQQGVWYALLKIPYGRYSTYGELAQHLGQAQAARAVGMAVGRNPLSIIVPCHRVVGANGTLTGYAGGLWRKMDLLQREGTLL
jgi:methylated-DNA-[protein]-cysteine S-methyltransferase